MTAHEHYPTDDAECPHHLDLTMNKPTPAAAILTSQQLQDPEKQSNTDIPPPKTSIYAGLGWLDRFLVIWILLAIIIGILLGNLVEDVGPALQRGKFVDVSIPIVVGLLVMMYPILCKVKYETLHKVFAHRQIWIRLGFSIVVNWIVAPLVMLGLAWAFLPDEPGLRNGLIFVGLARCIAMVRSLPCSKFHPQPR